MATWWTIRVAQYIRVTTTPTDNVYWLTPTVQETVVNKFRSLQTVFLAKTGALFPLVDLPFGFRGDFPNAAYRQATNNSPLRAQDPEYQARYRRQCERFWAQMGLRSFDYLDASRSPHTLIVSVKS